MIAALFCCTHGSVFVPIQNSDTVATLRAQQRERTSNTSRAAGNHDGTRGIRCHRFPSLAVLMPCILPPRSFIYRAASVNGVQRSSSCMNKIEYALLTMRRHQYTLQLNVDPDFLRLLRLPG